MNSSPPVMITPPSNITILEGGDARLTCETKGAPKPVVTWKKGILFQISFRQPLYIFYLILLALFVLNINIYLINSITNEAKVTKP